MKSVRTKQFHRLFAHLPSSVQEQAPETLFIFTLIQPAQSLHKAIAQGIRHGLPATVMAQENDFGHDRQSDLFGRAAAEVEADGGAHAGEFFRGNAFVMQQFEDGPDAALATDHADIGRR